MRRREKNFVSTCLWSDMDSHFCRCLCSFRGGELYEFVTVADSVSVRSSLPSFVE